MMTQCRGCVFLVSPKAETQAWVYEEKHLKGQPEESRHMPSQRWGLAVSTTANPVEIEFVSKVNCQRRDSFSVSASGNHRFTPRRKAEAKRCVEHLRAQPQEETCKRCKDCRKKLLLVASSESRQARLAITPFESADSSVSSCHHGAAAPLPLCVHAKFVNACSRLKSFCH
jgi:hypothetical protein